MNCYKCATPLPDNSRFCLSCGADVSGEVHAHEKTLAVEQDPEIMMKLQADVGTEYVIEKELGRGGMAIVYLGHDAHLGRKVAVKLLPPELTFSAGQGVIERFKREARTSATLDHPNIIPVYRVSQGQKLFWYVMKFLEGEGLDTILKREVQLDIARAAHIIRQAADALDYAHQHQVIHRDIKPANIMLDKNDRVTVTDFGIAKALDASTLTASGSMIGTPYYMSPEQCSGKKVGPAADQYSLGVMAYQMLGGHLPFTGESLIDIVRQHCMDPVPPLLVLRPNLPPALVTVVEKSLAKHPDERFATCKAFADAFEAGAKGLDTTLPPSPKPVVKQRLSETKLVSPIPGAIRDAKQKVGGGRRVAALVGGVLVVAGAAVAVVLKPWQSAAGPVVQPPPVTGADSTKLATAPVDTAKPAGSGSDTPTPAAAPEPTTPAVSPTRVRFERLPRDAAIVVEGQPGRPLMTVRPNRSLRVTIAAPGYQRWDSTIRVPEGRTLAVRPGLRPAAGAQVAQQPTGVAPAPNRPAAPQATPQPVTPPPSREPAPAPGPAANPPAASSTGFVTVGSRPATASLSINGRAMSSNPVRNFEVPAGPVRVQVSWINSAGTPKDTTVTLQVAPGATVSRNIILPMGP